MYLLSAGGLTVGDSIFQLIVLLVVFVIPVTIIAGLFIFIKKRNDRLKRVEEKLDDLLERKK